VREERLAFQAVGAFDVMKFAKELEQDLVPGEALFQPHCPLVAEDN
jgi:hypothetical protein